MNLMEEDPGTKTILLIDEEINVREVVEFSLKDLAHWDVVIADSPLKGLQKASLVHPDAIILDWSLGGMDSFMFLKILRNNLETQAIPVVLLSAKARWLDSQLLRQYQIVGVILKPFDPVALPREVAKLLDWNLTLPLPEFNNSP